MVVASPCARTEPDITATKLEVMTTLLIEGVLSADVRMDVVP